MTTTSEDRIVSLAGGIFREDARHGALAHRTLSYGDGGVSDRIVHILHKRV